MNKGVDVNELASVWM